MELLKELHTMGKLTRLLVTNTLAYQGTELITTVKSLLIQGQDKPCKNYSIIYLISVFIHCTIISIGYYEGN
jgi:hypothetical protein